MNSISHYCFYCQKPLDLEHDHCRNCGRMIVQPVPQFGYSRPHFVALVCFVLLAVSLTGYATYLGVTHYAARRAAEEQRLAEAQRRAAAWAEYQHRLLLARTFRNLQIQYPASHFAAYPKNGGSVTLNAGLKQATVRYLIFSHSDDKFRVTVGLYGSQEEAQAPLVNVTLYDERGSILSQGTIVKYTFAELGHGEVRDVEDEMPYPYGAQPEFVGVDGGS